MTKKEISAQKLCAGTVSGATHKAGGFILRHPKDVQKACEAAKKAGRWILQRTNRTIPYFQRSRSKT
jgi:hypothetical protein